MSYHSGNENLLYELAQTLAAGSDHSTAIALRKLVQAGYTSLEQVDGASDWILLSIPGVGVRRLGAVRALTRPEWQPPSPRAIQVTGWYLTAARFALRFWPADALASMIQGSSLETIPGEPAEMRLAIDVFARAIHDALAYCDVQELLRLLQQVGSVHPRGSLLAPVTQGNGDLLLKASVNRHGLTPSTGSSSTPFPRNDDDGESDHYAYPRQKRRDIARQFRLARKAGTVRNKEAWAQAHYNISGKTLLNYEREFPETGYET
jgi:hypothetical protein